MVVVVMMGFFGRMAAGSDLLSPHFEVLHVYGNVALLLDVCRSHQLEGGGGSLNHHLVAAVGVPNYGEGRLGRGGGGGDNTMTSCLLQLDWAFAGSW